MEIHSRHLSDCPEVLPGVRETHIHAVLAAVKDCHAPGYGSKFTHLRLWCANDAIA